MNIQQAKKISLVEFLFKCSYSPSYYKKEDAWYISPLRPQEKTPSFKINLNKNIWFDFGDSSGGNILDLVQKLFDCSSVSLALQKIEQIQQIKTQPKNELRLSNTLSNDAIIKIEHSFQEFKIRHLENHVLFQYLNQRAINISIAKNYLLQANYVVNDRKYFALAFLNQKGGYELRSETFKGSTNPKAPTWLIANPYNGRSSNLMVFEGFMDFLSMLTIQNWVNIPADVIILNSLLFVSQIESKLSQYQHYDLYLDNDDSGRDASKRFNSHQTTNHAVNLYPNYKDVNDWLLNHHP